MKRLLRKLWWHIRLKRCCRCGELGRHRSHEYTVLGDGIMCYECMLECCL